MSLSVISNVVVKSKVMSSMDCVSSVVRFVSNTVLGIGFVNRSNHMEVDSISSNLEGLTHLSHLNAIKSSNERVVTL